MSIQIKRDDLSRSDVIALLEDHLHQMSGTAPAESRHALDLSGLKQPDVYFYTLWKHESLAACGALMQHDNQLGELKSMKTHADFLRQGFAREMLIFLIEEAKRLGLKQLKLETGSMDYFKPAHALYRHFGFQDCEPFAQYQPDPNSLFMVLDLSQ